MGNTFRSPTALLLLLLAAGCAGARVAHEYVYSPAKKEYMGLHGGKKEALRAGRFQQVAISFPTAVESVSGRIGEMAVPFQSDSEGKHWLAAFDVPAFEALGPDKVMRVYMKAVDETTAGGLAEPEMVEIPISR
jgi:hypothetical protein